MATIIPCFDGPKKTEFILNFIFLYILSKADEYIPNNLSIIVLCTHLAECARSTSGRVWSFQAWQPIVKIWWGSLTDKRGLGQQEIYMISLTLITCLNHIYMIDIMPRLSEICNVVQERLSGAFTFELMLKTRWRWNIPNSANNCL